MRRYRILSIDGGGVKGIIPAIWLREIERKLPNPLYTYFDIVAGTSSGSITACAVASGRAVKEVVEIYQNEVGRTFKQPWYRRIVNPFGSIYPSTGIEKILKEQFGDLLFKDLKIPTMAISYDLTNQSPAIFFNEDDHDGKFKVRDVCRASSAAPIYFPPAKLECPTNGATHAFIDGAVVSNNPTDFATIKYLQDREQGQKPFILSLGCGSPYYELDAEAVCEWNSFDWLGNITRIVFDGTSDGVDFVLKHKIGEDSYARWQVPLKNASNAIDDSSKENMALLELEAYNFISTEEGKAKLEQAITHLLPDNTE